MRENLLRFSLSKREKNYISFVVVVVGDFFVDKPGNPLGQNGQGVHRVCVRAGRLSTGRRTDQNYPQGVLHISTFFVENGYS